MPNKDILDEFDELFGEDGDKSATVNVGSSSDPEIAEMLENAGKEVEKLGGSAEQEPAKEPLKTKEDAPKDASNEDATKEDASKDETSGGQQLDLFPEANKGVKQNACGATPNTKKGKNKGAGGSCASTPAKPKEPENDLERYVVLTNYNEQRTFPPELTLEQIREELEKEYPAYSKENTAWHFEKQEDKNRYLCIPNYKSNKAG